jgi:hypothetical protein
VFDNNQFVLYDFSKNSGWQVGDIEGFNGYNTIAEDAAVVTVDQENHRTSAMQTIVVGGTKGGNACSSVIGLDFNLETVNAVENYVCSLVAQLPDLTSPRFMHQAAIVRGKSNSWSLLVVGGKSSPRSWLKSVEMLDLLPYFKQGLMAKDAEGNLKKMTSSWKICADMQAARSNFAMIAMSNFVYVYGGIMCAGEGEMAHWPIMADPLIERYAPQTDKWDTITITQAPSLGAFSWS